MLLNTINVTMMVNFIVQKHKEVMSLMGVVSFPRYSSALFILVERCGEGDNNE